MFLTDCEAVSIFGNELLPVLAKTLDYFYIPVARQSNQKAVERKKKKLLQNVLDFELGNSWLFKRCDK